MEGSTILVIGSTNTDLVVRSPRFPRPGETLVGSDFATYAGGKGANQAVAAARLSPSGGKGVRYIAKVGKDDFGKRARAAAEAEGMGTGFWIVDEETPSGMAVITVNDAGENTIVVVPGANGTLSPTDLENQSSAFAEVDYLLLQLETPLATVAAAADHANALQIPVVLNPAPAQHLEQSLLKN